MRLHRHLFVGGIVFGASVLALPCAGQKRAVLNELEEDRVRETQDPSERIEVYLDLLDVRLGRFEQARQQPPDPKFDQAGFLHDLLSDYVALNDELKTWIEDHYQRNEDMRGGLRKLIESGPRQLLALRGIKQQGGPDSESYSDTLQDAIDQLADTIDGATVALRDQDKKLTQLKKQEKEDVKLAKDRAKEASRRTKKEKQERKRDDKKRTVPGDLPEE